MGPRQPSRRLEHRRLLTSLHGVPPN